VTRRVFFYVQHLLGVGHLFRAVRVAHGLKEAGFEVDLVMGGVPVADLDFDGLNVTQLLPLKAGPGGFSDLVTMTGESAGPEIRARRITELLSAFARSRPDIILIEAFPFGRRQMRFELMPLLEAAHRRDPRPRVFSSVRDILQESRQPQRVQGTIETLRRWFDGIIVHGDPSIVRLDETFPIPDDLKKIVFYSGMVGPPPLLSQRNSPSAAVVVSAGGGAVGRRLLETAIAAKPLTSLASERWLVLTGPNLADRDFNEIRKFGERNGITVRRFVPDLAATLASAELSISQAGYNTVADVLSARCRAVFVPFSEAGETEQARRASLLQAHGFGVKLDEAALSPASLAAAAEQARALPPPSLRIELNGAARTGALLASLLAET